MVVALTGASGFIGSHIADELYRRGHRVRCLLRASSSTRWIDGKPYERVVCSFSEQQSL
ncbi:MAG: NAD-dependent epimerase/dehydratase family protein, partial [Endomicrobia bacterium]|nr:NAD-dependent epimerase/dehydratase family protein [Endomicrobiia bacterium]